MRIVVFVLNLVTLSAVGTAQIAVAQVPPPPAIPGTPSAGMPPEGESCESDGGNRQRAEQFVETFNRMLEGVNAMSAEAARRSMEQARRNGAQVSVTPGAPVPVIAPVGENFVRGTEMLLDCAERRQMEAATQQAIAGPVGTAVRWTSASRPNVTGSSTVTESEATGADGRHCLVVTDIVIVDGQETRAPKRMCRIPPSNRYVRMA